MSNKLDDISAKLDQLIKINTKQMSLIARLIEISEGLHESDEGESGEDRISYPALYIDTRKGLVLVKKTPSEELQEVVRGVQYDLFRHIVELLQAGTTKTHWIWGFIIWPKTWDDKTPKDPKKTYGQYCAQLRTPLEKVWGLGKLIHSEKEKLIIGRGFGRSGSYPIQIQIQSDYFSTTAKPERTAYPVWSLFSASDLASEAYKQERWPSALESTTEVLQIDRENWESNTSLCLLSIKGHADSSDPFVKGAIEFAYRKLEEYQRALAIIKNHRHKPQVVGKELDEYEEAQKNIQRRLDALEYMVPQLLTPAAGSTPLSVSTSTPVSHSAGPTKTVDGEPSSDVKGTLPKKPWRAREELIKWAGYLEWQTNQERLMEEGGTSYRDLPSPKLDSGEVKVIQSVQSFVINHSYCRIQGDVKSHFWDFITELISNEEEWRDEKLPRKESSFKWGALDYVMAKILNLDPYTDRKKVRYLYQLWGVEKQLWQEKESQPTEDELCKRLCSPQYHWSEERFNDILALSKSFPISIED